MRRRVHVPLGAAPCPQQQRVGARPSVVRGEPRQSLAHFIPGRVGCRRVKPAEHLLDRDGRTANEGQEWPTMGRRSTALSSLVASPRDPADAKACSSRVVGPIQSLEAGIGTGPLPLGDVVPDLARVPGAGARVVADLAAAHVARTATNTSHKRVLRCRLERDRDPAAHPHGLTGPRADKTHRPSVDPAWTASPQHGSGRSSMPA